MSHPTGENDGNGADPFTEWHGHLQNSRGDRAALRRAQTIDEVYGIVAFHTLLRRLGDAADHEAVARLAIALAEVKTDSGERSKRWGAALGRAFAALHEAKPRLSEDRLRLLAAAPDPDLFLRLVRGAIHLLDERAPLIDLANVVLAWHRPGARADVRRQLFLSYFETAPEPEKTDA